MAQNTQKLVAIYGEMKEAELNAAVAISPLDANDMTRDTAEKAFHDTLKMAKAVKAKTLSAVFADRMKFQRLLDYCEWDMLKQLMIISGAEFMDYQVSMAADLKLVWDRVEDFPELIEFARAAARGEIDHPIETA